jgi:hypothetical protein
MVRENAASIERWFFYQDVAELWKWARIDIFGTVLSYSGASFATRDECVDDARRAGYSDHPAPEAPAPVHNVRRLRAAPPHRY